MTQISCGASFTIALTTSGVYSWGSGDGGRLGHGDNKDRYEPTEIESLSEELVLQVACGQWHACAIADFACMQICIRAQMNARNLECMQILHANLHATLNACNIEHMRICIHTCSHSCHLECMQL